MRQYSCRRSESGSIIVVALWVLVILSVMGVALGNFVQGQIKFSSSLGRKAISAPLARAACRDAIKERRADATPGFDSPGELARERSHSFDNGTGYKYHFEDELSKINVNTAKKEVLARLPGLDEDLADKIVNSSRRPFKVKEELLLVEDLTKDNFDKFKELVTVYGKGKVNINTASQPVLEALGLDEDVAKMIIRYRAESAGPDQKKDTPDDGAFTDPALILTQLQKFDNGLSARDEEDIIALKPLLATVSGYLTVKVSALVRSAAGGGYAAVIDTEKEKVLFWSEL